jgi:ketosteroid isomerase-like protein
MPRRCRSCDRPVSGSQTSKTGGRVARDARGVTPEAVQGRTVGVEESEDRRQLFEGLLHAWCEAIVANDPDAIDAFADRDWVLVGEGGAFPRAQFLESIAAGRLTHDTMRHEIHDVRVHGDVAIVISRVANSGTWEGEAFELDEWTTDVFVRRDEGWKCSVTHLTSVASPP